LAPSGDVITNGDFESGLAPWSLVGSGTGTAKVVSGIAHSGTHSAFMGTTAPPAPNGLHGIAQSVTVPASGSLDFWYMGGTNDTTQYADQEADLTDSSGRVVFQCMKTLVNTTTWTEKRCDVSAYAGRTLNVTFGVNDNGYFSAYVYMYVDQVTLTGGGPTPSPSPTPLDTPSPTPTPTPHPTPTPTATPVGNSPIQHVVILMQENRSVDNLFNGFPGANTVAVGKHYGSNVPLTKVHLGTTYDPGHGLYAFNRDYDFGLLDGFQTGQTSDYSYVDPLDIKEYWDLAKQYVFSDNTFTSNIDASFSAHQFLIAGQAGFSVDFPSATCADPTAWVSTITSQRTLGPPQEACFDYQALPDEIAAAGLTWRYYAAVLDYLHRPVWVPTEYIEHLYGNPNVIFPETQVLTDIANGQLANVTWITPSLPNSDHSGPNPSTGGPGWVASIVNAIGASPMWSSTVIFLSWDEWGGWYDHVVPPYKDVNGLGFRVPMIVISPFAKQGYVTHTEYETTSLLRFIENNFGLPALTAADQRAADPRTDVLNVGSFSRPAPFRPIAIRHRFAWAWMGASPDDDK
jgi:phospholipase C